MEAKETIFFIDNVANCKAVQDLSLRFSGPTSGLLFSASAPRKPVPVICDMDTCNFLDLSTRKWTAIKEQFGRKRSGAASIVIDNGRTLWITGGQFQRRFCYNSTVFVSTTESSPFTIKPGPELPINVTVHCLNKINASTALLIGGIRTPRGNSPLFLDIPGSDGSSGKIQIQSSFVGPELKVARYSPACGVLSNPGDGSSHVVIVAGGTEAVRGGGLLRSTEILALDSSGMIKDDGWNDVDVPELPGKAFNKATGVTTSDGKTMLVVGGEDDKREYLNWIVKLEFQLEKGWQWTKLDQELQVARTYPVAMMVPATFC